MTTLPQDNAMPLFNEREEHWWNFGNYTGDDCPNCGRQRLMETTDNQGNQRIICEKCNWEPAINDYRFAHPVLDGGGVD